MHGFASNVLSCQERERLEEELFEVRTRGRNLVPAAASDLPGTGGSGTPCGSRSGAWLRAVTKARKKVAGLCME